MPEGHNASQKLQQIITTLTIIQQYQKQLNKQQTLLHDFKMIVLDNTNSNIGDNGLFGLLEQERKKSWELLSDHEKKNNNFEILSKKGCDDHICSLVAKEQDKQMVIKYQEWLMTYFITNANIHFATFSVIHIVKRLSNAPFGRAFRYFCKSNRGNFNFTKFTPSRYASVFVASLTVYLNYYCIILFLCRYYKILTDLDKKVCKFQNIYIFIL